MCSVLHDQRLAHTDLKPENILFVDSDYEYCGTKRIHHKVTDNLQPFNNIYNNRNIQICVVP